MIKLLQKKERNSLSQTVYQKQLMILSEQHLSGRGNIRSYEKVTAPT